MPHPRRFSVWLPIGLLPIGLLALPGSLAPAQEPQEPEAPATDEVETLEVAHFGAETRLPTMEELDEYRIERTARIPGQFVTAVEPEGPAAQAGLQPGDILLQIGEMQIHSRDHIEDFLRVTLPGTVTSVQRVRGADHVSETIPLTVGSHRVATPDHPAFAWEYAGDKQLPLALERAAKEKKLVMVGLFGTDACCPGKRLEFPSVSEKLDRAEIIDAAAGTLTVIIRRPEAYRILRHHPEGHVPGILLLDGADKVVGAVYLRPVNASERLLSLLKRATAK